MRLTRWDTVRSVLLPAALPDIFSGIRIGFSLTLIGTILEEMFGPQRGLGYLLMTAIGLQNIQVIMSVTLLLVLVAATVNTVLLAQVPIAQARRVATSDLRLPTAARRCA